MGYGDSLMAIGDAWAMHSRDPKKRKVAIGNGSVVDKTDMDLRWGLHNFLASPEEVAAGLDVTWVHSYPGMRPYINYAAMRTALVAKGVRIIKARKLVSRLGHYIYDLSYRPTPAPIQFNGEEEALIAAWKARGPFVVVEPYIKASAPPSKQWPVERFIAVAKKLQQEYPVFQIGAPDRPATPGIPQIRPENFRQALAYLKAASLYIGPEGGLHHGSAAVGTPAVVIYGGFTSPHITGYPKLHVNLTGNNGGKACGTRNGMCPHCKTALDSILVPEVVGHARRLLLGAAP